MTHLLRVASSPPDELDKMLNESVIGTPGHGMLYQHTTAFQKLVKIPRPFFVSLVRSEKILGTCTFCRRDTMNNGRAFDSFYLRFFTFRNRNRRQSARLIKKNGLVRRAVGELLEGNCMGSKGAHFYYAYYDPANKRSVLFASQFGFSPVRQFKTVLLTRFKLKQRDNSSITEVSEKEHDEVRELINEYYQSYTMLQTENLFRYGKYFVLRNETGEIVAGIQANPEKWTIHSLKPPAGSIAINIVSAIPWINRVINKNWSFITIDAVFCKRNHEEALEHLLEHALSHFGCHTAMTFADADSSILQCLKKLDLGLIGTLNSSNTGAVICKFRGMSEKDIATFENSPAYISAIDLT